MSAMWRRGGNGNNDDDNFNDFIRRKNYRGKNRLKALVVDDGGVERIISSAMLRTFGVQTRVACSGTEAVNCVASGEVFNIIFVDRYMPVMDGLETIRMLRAMGFRKKIVGVGSEMEKIEDEERDLLIAGADYFVLKPISLLQIGFFVAEIEAAI